MSVRRMSAHQTQDPTILTAKREVHAKKNADFFAEMSSPKAEVTSSNLVGRAKLSGVSQLAQSA